MRSFKNALIVYRKLYLKMKREKYKTMCIFENAINFIFIFVAFNNSIY